MTRKRRKKRGSQPKAEKHIPKRLAQGLDLVDELLADGDIEKAEVILATLLKQYPRHPEVLRMQVNFCIDYHDMNGVIEAGEALLAVDKNDPDVYLTVSGAYLAQMYPALALEKQEIILERWPDYARIDDVRETAVKLKNELAKEMSKLGRSGEEGIAMAIWHERGRMLLETAEYAKAIKEITSFLQVYPDFVPALNNLSTCYYAQADLDQALTVCEQALALEPDNVHALSNKVRFLLLSGEAFAALGASAKLKAAPTDKYDSFTKKAEAFSYLALDQDILDTFATAETESSNLDIDFLLHHLTAVAALRLGDEKRARKLWETALKINPGFINALENLEDLHNPVGEREAPWAFPFGNWLSRTIIQEYSQKLETVLRRNPDNETLQKWGLKIIEKYPQLEYMIPILLNRGDPAARSFMLMLARLIETPTAVAALHTFAFGQRGTDEDRLDTFYFLSQAKQIPPDPVKLWLRGEWQEVMPMNFEITDEPDDEDEDVLNPEAEELFFEAMEIIYEDPDEAEHLLNSAILHQPDSPTLLNNLSAIYAMQGRTKEAEKLINEIHQNFPDYFFGITNYAKLLVQQGKVDEAAELLAPLMERKKLHITEFEALCMAQIDLFLKKGEEEGARSWLGMWQSVNPEHPHIEIYQQRLAFSSNPLGKIVRKLVGR